MRMCWKPELSTGVMIMTSLLQERIPEYTVVGNMLQ